MVFFLHVPRTAGRTYHSCFLKLATPPSGRCEKSYDELRLSSSVSGCSLLGSHDDFSVRQHMPADTAVVTQLRCCMHETSMSCRPCPLISSTESASVSHAWHTARHECMHSERQCTLRV